MERTSITLRRINLMVDALRDSAGSFTTDQKRKINSALILLTEVQDERSNE